ncbi:hypothetical protein [Burkholderia sp. BCC1630]|uniref:hypothetical protein n=1 Tax=Burkholderia sp. BCC1630 TaxID=2676304 RepID=UPI001588A281|nr:hypothetical protein [Burkholderia sp. BCC1630]
MTAIHGSHVSKPMSGSFGRDGSFGSPITGVGNVPDSPRLLMSKISGGGSDAHPKKISDQLNGVSSNTSKTMPSEARVSDGAYPGARSWNDFYREQALAHVDGQTGGELVKLLNGNIQQIERNQLTSLAVVVYAASRQGKVEIPKEVTQALGKFLKSAQASLEKHPLKMGFQHGETSNAFAAANKAVHEWFMKDRSEIMESYHAGIDDHIVEHILSKEPYLKNRELTSKIIEMADAWYTHHMTQMASWLDSARYSKYHDVSIGQINTVLDACGDLEKFIRPLFSSSNNDGNDQRPSQSERGKSLGPDDPRMSPDGQDPASPYGARMGGQLFNQCKNFGSPRINFAPKIKVSLGDAVKEALAPVMRMIDSREQEIGRELARPLKRVPLKLGDEQRSESEHVRAELLGEQTESDVSAAIPIQEENESTESTSFSPPAPPPAPEPPLWKSPSLKGRTPRIDRFAQKTDGTRMDGAMQQLMVGVIDQLKGIQKGAETVKRPSDRLLDLLNEGKRTNESPSAEASSEPDTERNEGVRAEQETSRPKRDSQVVTSAGGIRYGTNSGATGVKSSS